MENKRHTRKWKILITALILLLLVVATAVYLCVRLGVFTKTDDSPYIDIAPSDDVSQSTQETSDQEGTAATQPTQDTFQVKPGFEVWDDQQTWTTQTDIELFRISYEGGEQNITVLSDNGDEVIAPGTDNSYTFRLKNTGNVALDYTVSMEAVCSDNVTYIPVDVRMRDYNGDYCIGNREGYAPVSELNGLEDSNTLGVGSYAYYTLEWQWPFESGDDEYDTWLGNLEEPATLIIKINTYATTSADPNAMGGLSAQTGDTFLPALWIALAALSATGIVILVVYKARRRREEDR